MSTLSRTIPSRVHPSRARTSLVDDTLTLVHQLKQQLEALEDDNVPHADRIVLYSRLMQKVHELADWISDRRADAVMEFMQDPDTTESLSSVARRAGLSPQALSKVHAIERAKRGEL